MNPHRHLHSPASNSNLSSASREDYYSGGSGAANSIASSSITSANHNNNDNRPRARLLATIHRFVRPSSGGLRASSMMPRSGSATTSTPSPAASFRIVHERDDTPAYTPARPTVPRTNSECQAALEEMFARARGEDDEDEDDEEEDLEQGLEGLWEESLRVGQEEKERVEQAATAAKTVLGRAEQQRRHDQRYVDVS